MTAGKILLQNWLFPQDHWCRILRICFLFNFSDIFECCLSESSCTCIFLYARKGVWSLSMWLSSCLRHSVSRLLLRATSFMCDKDWEWGSFFKNQIGLWRTRICWDRVIQHDSYHSMLVRQEFWQVLRVNWYRKQTYHDIQIIIPNDSSFCQI